jgi:toxin-antitoxin system PIN domain toxin
LNTTLLDVNLFIAILWPAHEHHHTALKWIKSRGKSKWASCPLTQLGVVRLLSNPAFSADALPMQQAVAVLKRNIDHPLHEFWLDSVAVTGFLAALAQHTQGYRYTTEAYLLGLAIRKKGRLATFDMSVKELASNAGKNSYVEVLS